jgi:hypothetical protein
VENIELDAVREPIIVTMNWNPTYSYSTLPAGYTEATLPEHWKKMLAPVTPAQGTPHFRNVTIRNLRATSAGQAISAEGLPTSVLENFKLENIVITGAKAGKIDYAKDWSIKGLSITADNQQPIAVQNSAGVKL